MDRSLRLPKKWDMKKNRLKAALLCLSLPFLWFGFGYPGTLPAIDGNPDERLQKSVVKITVFAQFPDYAIPWNPGDILSSMGTGFVISGNRILTNAHVASNARFIAVEKEGDSRKYEARVRFIAHDCDLSLLEIPDGSFFDPRLALNTGKRLVMKSGAINQIIYTSIKERGIAHYLSWIEEYILQIREDIRLGKRVEELKLICTPI